MKIPAIRIEQHYDNREVKCFAERPANLDAMFRATVARVPDALALIADAERFSYRELDQRIDIVVTQLQQRGIGHGDRVALLIGNRPIFVFALMAILRIGAICVPMNTRQRQPEIAFMAAQSGACAVLFDEACVAELPQQTDAVSVHTWFRADAQSNLQLDSRSATAPQQIVQRAIHEEDPCCIIYTSGTTGKPKGATLTHFGLIHSTLHYEYGLQLHADDVAMLAVPATHVTGLVAIIFAMMRVGGRTVMIENFHVRVFLELAAREKMTYTLVVPAIYNLVLLQPDFAQFDLSAWRLGGFGGAPMPVTTIERLAEALPNLVLANVYGATETSGPTTILPLGEALRRRDTIGKIVPCGDVRVCDEQGNEVAPGTAGEFRICGPMVVPSYWENPTANASSFTDGYWHSGDIGSIDADGWVRIFDRKKDMVNRGGYKIYCSEVENVLCRHESVIECAIIGRPDTVLGERVHAFIVTKTKNISVEELRAYCATNLSDYKVPETIDFIDALPRNAAGKVVKQQLREMLAASSLNR